MTEYISRNIVPAIMPESFDQLNYEMKRFVSAVPLIQIDVMDGNLSPSKSWPYKNIVDGEFLKIVNQEVGFPFWEELDFEVDLMVTDPVRMADQWIAAGAARVIVHLESGTPDLITSVLKSVKDKGIEAGLALGLETPIETSMAFYEENKDSIDMVQFMGIEKIGFQGQPFAEQVLERISKFRESYPDILISVDGGVSIETAPGLIAAGVNRLVVGSALSEGNSVVDVITELDSILNKA